MTDPAELSLYVTWRHPDGPISYDTFLERVMEGDTLRAEVTSHRSADVNRFTRNP